MEIHVFTCADVENYSVTAEFFASQQDQQLLTNDAWEKILTFGNATIDLIKSICSQIEEAQKLGG